MTSALQTMHLHLPLAEDLQTSGRSSSAKGLLSKGCMRGMGSAGMLSQIPSLVLSLTQRQARLSELLLSQGHDENILHPQLGSVV